MRPRLLTGLVTAAVLLTGGCSGGFDEDAPADLRADDVDTAALHAPSALALETALELEGQPITGSPYDDGRPQVLVDDDVAVLVGGEDLRAWSPATHEESWTASYPAGVCAADGVRDSRIAVTFTASQGREPCTRVALLDATTGEQVWRRDVGPLGLVDAPP